MVETIKELIEKGYMITWFDANIRRRRYENIPSRRARTNMQDDEDNPRYFISVELKKHDEIVKFDKSYDSQGMYGIDLKAFGETFIGPRLVVESDAR